MRSHQRSSSGRPRRGTSIGWSFSELHFLSKVSRVRHEAPASITTVAIVACAVLRLAYPATWAELEKLHLTPVELAAYLFGAIEYLKRNTEE